MPKSLLLILFLSPGNADDEQGEDLALKTADSDNVFKVMMLSLLHGKGFVSSVLELLDFFSAALTVSFAIFW